MATRNIVKLGDDTLRKVCKPQEKFDLRLWTLLKDMADTMYKAEGVGLAAPQVGILRRVVVIDVGDGLVELINPEIVAQEGSQCGREGCLSLPGRQGVVTRPHEGHRARPRTASGKSHPDSPAKGSSPGPFAMSWTTWTACSTSTKWTGS